MWSRSARSAASASLALASGDLAFHSSQTDWAKASSVARPASESSSRRCMITAPDPTWDKTSAMVHSLG